MLLNKRIPFSFVFNKIKYDLITVLAVAFLIILVTEKYATAFPEIPLTIAVFIGTAISILLSFKLNQSYDRWWEARKVWGAIVNDSRTLVIQLKAFLGEEDKAVITRIALRQIAWCYSLSHSLRGHDPLEGLGKFVDAVELRHIGTHQNKPLAILDLHSQDIKTVVASGRLALFAQVQLDNTLVRLCDSQGKCERIKNTVFPVTYRKFLHYIIYLFVITLSISLNNLAFYYELPLLIFISSAFFLLERSATHMQDPFENRPTDTPMTAISRSIEINIKQLLGASEVPSPLEPHGFYIN
jgi:ion channel-forming bestrophin family protein